MDTGLPAKRKDGTGADQTTSRFPTHGSRARYRPTSVQRKNCRGDLIGLVQFGQTARIRDRTDLSAAGDAARTAPRSSCGMTCPRRPTSAGSAPDQRQPLLEPGVAERPEDAGRSLRWRGSARSSIRASWRPRGGLDLVPALRFGAQSGRALRSALRPGIGRRVIVHKEARRRDQGESAHRCRARSPRLRRQTNLRPSCRQGPRRRARPHH